MTKKEEIANLQAQVASLTAALAAKPIEPASGIFVVTLPAETGVADYAQLLERWNSIWQERGVETPPALLPIPEGVTLEQVDYNGFGIFCLRAPDDTPPAIAARWSFAWDLAWQNTPTPQVPMIVMGKGVDIERITDKGLQVLGLMRIPDQRTGHA